MLIAEHEHGFTCSAYDFLMGEEFLAGVILFGGPEPYWHFYPSRNCRQLTAADLKNLLEKVVELNKAIRDSTKHGTET